MKIVRVTGITFGKITAVSGKPSKMKFLNKAMDGYVQNKTIMRKDVTSKYVNASTSGLMAKAANRGDSVIIYITGDDIQRIKMKVPQWDTIEGVLSNITEYINLNNLSLMDAADKIREK